MSTTNADLTMSTAEVEYRLMSQNYSPPKAVTKSLQAASQQANASAIVMGLFAGALVSFAQIVNGGNPASTTAPISWGAMLVFLYGAIMLSISGSFLSLAIIKMCSDLPLAAQQRILNERFSTSTKPLSDVASGKPLPAYLLSENHRLLEHFGMSKRFKRVDQLNGLVLFAACICTFAALTLWIFLSETIITAALTVIFFGMTAIIVIYVYITASTGQGWN